MAIFSILSYPRTACPIALLRVTNSNVSGKTLFRLKGLRAATSRAICAHCPLSCNASLSDRFHKIYPYAGDTEAVGWFKLKLRALHSRIRKTECYIT